MVEDKQKSGNVGSVVKAVLDPITKFWEGISQAINVIFQDRNLFEVIVLGLIGVYGFNRLVTQLSDLVKDNEAERQEHNRKARMLMLKLVQDIGAEKWDQVTGRIGEAYSFLKKKQLMTGPELERFMRGIDMAKTRYRAERFSNKKLKQVIAVIGFGAFWAIGSFFNAPVWMGVAATALIAIGVCFAVYYINKRVNDEKQFVADLYHLLNPEHATAGGVS